MKILDSYKKIAKQFITEAAWDRKFGEPLPTLKDVMNEAEVDDDKVIKYKKKDGEQGEMKASSARSMEKDHPAKIAYDKMKGDDDSGEKEKGKDLGAGDFERPGTDTPSGDEKPSDEPDEKGEIDINTFDGVKKHADKVEKALDLLSNDMKKFKDEEPPYNDLSNSEWEKTNDKLRDAETKLSLIIRDDPRDDD